MRHMSARDAKNGCGRLIDDARAEPVTIEKHGRVLVVVRAIEEYQKLTGQDIVGEFAIKAQNSMADDRQ